MAQNHQYYYRFPNHFIIWSNWRPLSCPSIPVLADHVTQQMKINKADSNFDKSLNNKNWQILPMSVQFSAQGTRVQIFIHDRIQATSNAQETKGNLNCHNLILFYLLYLAWSIPNKKNPKKLRISVPKNFGSKNIWVRKFLCLKNFR